MIPAPPFLLRIWISFALMWTANRLARVAGWITPEIVPGKAVAPIRQNQRMP